METTSKSKYFRELVAALSDGDLERADRAMGDLDLQTGLLGEIQGNSASNVPATLLRDAYIQAKRNARLAQLRGMTAGAPDDVPTEAWATCPAPSVEAPKTYGGGVLVPGGRLSDE